MMSRLWSTGKLNLLGDRVFWISCCSRTSLCVSEGVGFLENIIEQSIAKKIMKS